MRKICFLCLLLFSPPAFGAKGGYYVGIGPFFGNILKVTKSPQAKRSLFGEAYMPEIAAGWRVWYLFPLVGWTPFGNYLNDGGKKRSLMRIEVPYVFSYGKGTEFKLGGGMLFHRIRGEGGAVSLRNGSNPSQTFYVPSGNRSSNMLYTVIGVGVGGGNVRFDYDLLATGLFTRRRAFHVSIRGGYVF